LISQDCLAGATPQPWSVSKGTIIAALPLHLFIGTLGQSMPIPWELFGERFEHFTDADLRTLKTVEKTGRFYASLETRVRKRIEARLGLLLRFNHRGLIPGTICHCTYCKERRNETYIPSTSLDEQAVRAFNEQADALQNSTASSSTQVPYVQTFNTLQVAQPTLYLHTVAINARSDDPREEREDVF
jgi:hypothetical protein